MKLVIEAAEPRNKIDCQGCNHEWNQGHNCYIFGAKSPYRRLDKCKRAEKLWLESQARVKALDGEAVDLHRCGNCAGGNGIESRQICGDCHGYRNVSPEEKETYLKNWRPVPPAESEGA